MDIDVWFYVLYENWLVIEDDNFLLFLELLVILDLEDMGIIYFLFCVLIFYKNFGSFLVLVWD